MKTFVTKLYSDFDKENDSRRVINMPLSRHCRVQSSFALNLRREKSLNTTTNYIQPGNLSSQNISGTYLGDKRPHMRVQLSKLGVNESYDVSQQGPTSRTRDNSFNLLAKVERLKTEISSQPMRVGLRNQSYGSQNTQLNPQGVSAYFDDILGYMIETQVKDDRKYDAFTFQSDITEKMRSVLLDWIVDVHLKFKLLPETLFLTIHIIDMYCFDYMAQHNRTDTDSQKPVSIVWHYCSVHSCEVRRGVLSPAYS